MTTGVTGAHQSQASEQALDDSTISLDDTSRKLGTPRAARAPPLGLPAWAEILGLAGLALLASYFLAISWRRWPDPLIDFGRELYLPWRLSQGAVLYRDAEDFYGPLSQYFNAGLFRLFGPGLMVLVAANLAIFTAILASIYRLFRVAWGPGAAFVSAAIFISVFGFSQYTGFGNYNYATPYSHEATHGLLVCLLLVAVLAAWVENSTTAHSFLAGALLGLTLVLKPELILAAVLLTLAAACLRVINGPPPRSMALGAWVVGAILPTALFVAWFAGKVPIMLALEYACRAWLNVMTTRFTGDPSQLRFLGLDKPWPHLLEHLSATLGVIAIVLVIGGCAWLADRLPRREWRFLMCGVLWALAFWMGWWVIPWEIAGRSLLGLVLLYLLACAWRLRPALQPAAISPQSVLRILLAVLAAALMARMLLSGRIHQFGFYQAALAAVLLPAVMIGELPSRLGLSAFGRAMVAASCLCLLVPGVVMLTGWSKQMLEMKTYPVAEGSDRFYAYDPRVERTGEFVRTASEELRRASGGRKQTLLVLPDGEMINYLARMPSPVAPAFFFSSATSGGREAAIVRDLERRPPDWIVLISRDLREFGIRRYGERDGQGKAILDWASVNYETAATLGGDPLDPRHRGVMLLAPRR